MQWATKSNGIDRTTTPAKVQWQVTHQKNP